MATVLMLRVPQNGGMKQDRRDLRKQRQYKTVNLHSYIDVSGSSRQL